MGPECLLPPEFFLPNENGDNLPEVIKRVKLLELFCKSRDSEWEMSSELKGIFIKELQNFFKSILDEETLSILETIECLSNSDQTSKKR